MSRAGSRLTQAARDRISAGLKARWQDPAYIEAQRDGHAARRARPSTSFAATGSPLYELPLDEFDEWTY